MKIMGQNYSLDSQGFFYFYFLTGHIFGHFGLFGQAKRQLALESFGNACII